MGFLRAAGAFLALSAVILGAPSNAAANKVGVAAAVNPDAFSGGQEIRIGKSIFYNEKITTDANGVVQVLLVDGSTFTVGKNSTVVIDKFVFDPNKQTGEVVASFSKGSIRFIGGKISKNPGGVTVNTPDGSLAIRGGMFQGTQTSSGALYSFLFGKELVFTGNSGRVYTVFQPGYTLTLGPGGPVIAPTTPADIQLVLANLTNSTVSRIITAATTVAPQPNFVILPFDFQQLIIDATGTRITDEILQQILALQNLPETPFEPVPDVTVDSTIGGYGSGIVYSYNDYYGEGGYTTAASKSSTDFAYNEQSNVITMTLRDVEDGGSIKRGIFKFSPVSNNNWNLSGLQLVDYNGNTIVPSIESGFAERRTQALCSGCNFIEWGTFGADYSYSAIGEVPGTTYENIELGWWVGGQVTANKDLPATGTANYKGTAIGTVTTGQLQIQNSENSQVVGTGNLGMNWNFAKRSGQFAITNFKAEGVPTLNAHGTMTMPGNLNSFSGALSGQAGQTQVTGGAFGSFVTDGKAPAAGVIGNWGVANGNDYRATGVFAGRPTN